ncbi:MAG: bifunctional ADP-heptose synthase [Crocinitomicaceae bacterium]|jgi:rfaE bifunctional protein kinase chain/domain
MNVEALFEEFTQKRILVLGDVMIDAYMRGSVTRVSPEAPVPIINLKKTEDRLGGAANVALNLMALGAEPILCAVIGNDKGGETFSSLLQIRNLTSEGIVKSGNRITTVKTRVIGNHQQLLRIDDEQTNDLTNAEENELIEKVKQIIASEIDAIIIEDYNKGLLTKRVIESVIQLANDNHIIIAVDPKKNNFFTYKNVTLFKPNLKELKEGLNTQFDFANDRDKFEKAIHKLEDKLQNKISFVTLSEYGVYIKGGNNQHYIDAHHRNISDVSGAGDTVISVATLCLTVGMDIDEIAEIANISGGLVCEISGVVPIDKERFKAEVLKLKTA